MRLQHFINEKVDDIVDILKDSCDDYLKEMTPMIRPSSPGVGWVYRGVAITYDDGYKPVYSAISDDNGLLKYKSYLSVGRRPRLASYIMHQLFNEAGKKVFGWKIRNGVSTSSYIDNLSTFGQPMIFLPIGEYEFVWSPFLIDFNQDLSMHIIRTLKLHDEPEKGQAIIDVIERHYDPKKTEEDYYKICQPIIDDFVKKAYKSTDFRGAVKSGNEIDFKCKSYYLVADRNNFFKALKKGGWLK